MSWPSANFRLISGAERGVRFTARGTSQVYGLVDVENIAASNVVTNAEAVSAYTDGNGVLGLTVLNNALEAGGGKQAARGIATMHSGASQVCLDVRGNTISMPAGASNIGVQVVRFDNAVVTVRNRDTLTTDNAITAATPVSLSAGVGTQSLPCTVP